MDLIADIHLTDGPVLWLAWAAGAAGGAWLLWRRGPGVRRWVLVVATAVLISAALVAAVHWLLIYVFSTLPEELPREVLAWFIPAVAALLLWVYRLWTLRAAGSTPPDRPAWRGRVLATVALLGVILLTAVQVNAYFGLNHTVSDIMGTAVARIQPLDSAFTRQPRDPAGMPLADWTAPAEMPDGDILGTAVIPGAASGFSSREAYIYLPPAYQVTPRPALPVLVLFSGQPGGPSDWLTGGALRSRLDRFAAAHHGVAPVVVVVDPNGSATANTLCMDSRIAKSDTFLSQDVPRWISQTLDVDTNHRRWAAGGFSFGATCAMQMGTRHPDIYHSVLAFSSEREPTLAKERKKTIEAAFGDDVAAFEAQTPLNVMKTRQYPGNAIYFGAGATDPEFVAYMGELSGAAREAGFDVEAEQIPNAGHSWETASRGLTRALDFMAGRWGIAP
ncbi:MAG: alpha/beta hydrolase-fold protein [Arthrobacter sp.]